MCGLFTMASALRRHVNIPKKYLGGWTCYPHLYVCFVAPAGTVTKSTSIGAVEELLDTLPQLHRTPSAFTVPIIVKRLSESPDSSLSVIVSELGTAAEKAGPGLYTVLTDLYDGKVRIDEETISRNVFEVINPCVNFLAATVPEWVADNMSSNILNGGYGSRTIHIGETAARNPRLFYHKQNNGKDYDKIKEDLVADLEHIAEGIFGEFRFEGGADDMLEARYLEDLADKQNNIFRRIAGYRQRRSTFRLKLCMLLQVSRSDDLVITPDICEEAERLLIYFEERMVNVFKNMGKNKYTTDINGILTYIQDLERVEEVELLEEFSAVADHKTLKLLLEGLIATKRIKHKMDNGKGYYYAV